jgi:ferric-dicitrate binding protein FerR (iron transport regulator)
MPAIITALPQELVASFRNGDEHAFEQLVLTRFDSLVEKTQQHLGTDSGAAPRVAMSVLLSAWTDRAQFTTPMSLDDYLDEAVPHRSADELRRRAALHRFEVHEGVQVTAPPARQGMSAAQAWDAISARLHVSDAEREEHREEARVLAKRHAREHVNSVAGQKLSMGMIITGVVLLIAVVVAMRFMDRGSAELALTRALEAEDVRVMRAAPGQRGTITLLDESTAQLAAGSTLRVPRGFGNDLRGLALDGAAHFVVAPNKSPNFEVRAHGTSIVATGTAFTVRAYDDEPDVLVTVREGSVRVVAGASETRTLNAGESVAIARDGSMRTPSPAELPLAFSWVDGELALENVSVAHALTQLRRWHNVDAQLSNDSLGARMISARLTLESAGEALNALSRAANLQVDYEGQQMVLRDAASSRANAAPSKATVRPKP